MLLLLEYQLCTLIESDALRDLLREPEGWGGVWAGGLKRRSKNSGRSTLFYQLQCNARLVAGVHLADYGNEQVEQHDLNQDHEDLVHDEELRPFGQV